MCECAIDFMRKVKYECSIYNLFFFEFCVNLNYLKTRVTAMVRFDISLHMARMNVDYTVERLVLRRNV